MITKQTRRINLDLVVQTAVTLADDYGFEGVTLASVAEQLGIRIPSLYNHVAGLAGLRYQMRRWGMLELGEQARRAAVGKAGDDAIVSLSNAYRAFAHAHPGVYPATLRATTSDEPELEAAATDFINVLIAVMEPYDFSYEDNLHAIRGLRSVMHGFVDLEIKGGFGMPLDRDESFRRLIEVFIQGLHARRATPDSA